ncbi:DUF6053 domain-containing protein [Lysobacter enzymogenes]
MQGTAAAGSPAFVAGTSAPTLFGQIAVACNDSAGPEARHTQAALSAAP